MIYLNVVTNQLVDPKIIGDSNLVKVNYETTGVDLSIFAPKYPLISYSFHKGVLGKMHKLYKHVQQSNCIIIKPYSIKGYLFNVIKPMLQAHNYDLREDIDLNNYMIGYYNGHNFEPMIRLDYEGKLIYFSDLFDEDLPIYNSLVDLLGWDQLSLDYFNASDC